MMILTISETASCLGWSLSAPLKYLYVAMTLGFLFCFVFRFVLFFVFRFG